MNKYLAKKCVIALLAKIALIAWIALIALIAFIAFIALIAIIVLVAIIALVAILALVAIIAKILIIAKYVYSLILYSFVDSTSYYYHPMASVLYQVISYRLTNNHLQRFELVRIIW